MIDILNARSFLFAPADDERKLASALRSSADAVIADLEDGVASAHKEVARDGLRSFADQTSSPLRLVRIAADEPRDVAAVADLRLDAVVVAKSTFDVINAWPT